jgi:hypothetical protein
VDTRIVNEVRTGTGKIIQSVTEAGGWPDFPSAFQPDQKSEAGHNLLAPAK